MVFPNGWLRVPLAVVGLLVVALACHSDPEETVVIRSDGGGPLPVLNLTKLSGDAQSGVACAPLTDSLVVIAESPTGQPDGGGTMTWATSTPGGVLTPAVSLTDAKGIARILWTLGCTPGVQTVTVTTRLALQPATFTATAIAPPDSTSLARWAASHPVGQQ